MRTKNGSGVFNEKQTNCRYRRKNLSVKNLINRTLVIRLRTCRYEAELIPSHPLKVEHNFMGCDTNYFVAITPAYCGIIS